MKKIIHIIFSLIALTVFVPLAVHAATIQAPNTNGLVGYWTMNEATGTTAHDFSGNKNTGTLTSGLTWTNGELASALSWPGTTQYVDVNQGTGQNLNFSNYPNGFSVSAWVYITDTSSSHALFGFGNPYNANGNGIIVSYGYPSTNRFGIVIDDGNASSILTTLGGSNALTVNKWVFVTCTFTPTTVTLYVNGVQSGGTTDITAQGISNLGNNDFKIGAFGASPTAQTWQGKIDDFRVYSRVLGTTEIASLYKDGAEQVQNGASNNGLVGYWNFNDATGTIVHDFSGNNDNLPIISGESWSSGRLGGGFLFSALSDLTIATTSAPKLQVTGDMTISAWVYLTTTAVQVFIDKSIHSPASGGLFMSYGLGGFGFNCGTDNSSNSPLIAQKTTDLNQWHMVTCTSVGGVRSLYIDGVFQASASGGASNAWSNNGDLFIGAGTNGSLGTSASNFMQHSKLDDIRVYSRGLSATEIANLYKQGAEEIAAPSPLLQNGTLGNGLVGLWTMDGGDTNWNTNTEVDRSGNGNNGSLALMSKSSPTVGKVGQAMSFNGTSQYIAINNAVYSVSGGSVSFWFKKTGNGTPNNVMIGSYNGSNSRAPTFSVPGSTLLWEFGTLTSQNSGVTIKNGQWYHVVFTYDSGLNYKLYVNGILITSGTSSGFLSPLGTVTLGAYDNASTIGQYFQGALDDVRIYNRVLSTTEVKQLYLLGH